MEMENRVPTADELDEWLKTTELPPLIDESDQDKEALIKNISWVDTRYGRKLKFTLQFDDGTEKGALLSKTLAKTFVIQAGTKNLAEMIGRRVVIKTVMVSTPQGVKQKATIIPKPVANASTPASTSTA